jgi:hypothetical protein
VVIQGFCFETTRVALRLTNSISVLMRSTPLLSRQDAWERRCLTWLHPGSHPSLWPTSMTIGVGVCRFSKL